MCWATRLASPPTRLATGEAARSPQMACLLRAVAGGGCTATQAAQALADGMSNTHRPTALQTSLAQHLSRPQRRPGTAARAPRPDWHLLSSCGAHAHAATGGGAPPPSSSGVYKSPAVDAGCWCAGFAAALSAMLCACARGRLGVQCGAAYPSAAASVLPTSPCSPLDPDLAESAAVLICCSQTCVCSLQGLAGRPVLYRGTLDCIRQVLRTEGIKGFYAASLPSYLKVGGAAGLGQTLGWVGVLGKLVGWWRQSQCWACPGRVPGDRVIRLRLKRCELHACPGHGWAAWRETDRRCLGHARAAC